MRSIWKGSISFGLVSIPVKLYSATEEKGVSFHQVHREDGGRIRYRRVCQVDGEEIPYSDIAKGYELSSGEVVVLTDDDFADLPLPSTKAVEVLQFVPLEQVDPMYYTRTYYLEPDAAGAKPYILLREALEQSGRVAVVKVALRQRESLACLRVRDEVLVLEMMLWPDEVREPDFGFLDEDISVRSQEVAMAQSLIDAMSGDFAPEEYNDEYREALEELIEAKVAGREVVEVETTEEQAEGTVVDLMAALRASVDAAKKGRGETKSAGGGKKSTAKKSATGGTKKAPAKKAAAGSGAKSGRKSATKKTAASTKKKATRRSA